MIEVLIKRDNYLYCDCESCGSTLKFTKIDVVEKTIVSGMYTFKYGSIICPNCNHEIVSKNW